MILLRHRGSDAEAESAIMSAWNSAMAICRVHRPAISHHHGIGIVRLRYIEAELGTANSVVEGMKQAFDPQRILNPGKLGLEPL
jgi:alkyldihydroxyacetonephosphate synthase